MKQKIYRQDDFIRQLEALRYLSNAGFRVGNVGRICMQVEAGSYSSRIDD